MGKVEFVENDGEYKMVNQLMLAINEAQEAFKGEAERLGLKPRMTLLRLSKKLEGRGKNN
jgi:hypothetical protein